ncbi:unnamed protein product [Onchocerca flexuosa]|uniref:Transmembrane protein n=1 Tax=Onchocerca flexuosa TaxID=387005 RepID=A0A183HG42_9BILA|nr:unnamed protein product [Onchocerca flexuosa]
MFLLHNSSSIPNQINSVSHFTNVKNSPIRIIVLCKSNRLTILQIKINPVAPQAAVAVFSFTATLFLLTAPETKDRPMPEDLDQFDPGCFLQMFDYRMQKKRGVLITAKDIEETSIGYLLYFFFFIHD